MIIDSKRFNNIKFFREKSQTVPIKKINESDFKLLIISNPSQGGGVNTIITKDISNASVQENDLSLRLDNLDGNNGFVINGTASNQFSGRSVSDLGDVNGDGFNDLLIGGPGAAGHGTNTGAAFVLFNNGSLGQGGNIELADLNGSNGFALIGINAGDRTGFASASVGDINGDGLDDFVLGAPYAGNNNSGSAYLIFGNKSTPPANIELSSLSTSNGIAINGSSTDQHLGFSVGTAGDFNGDNIQDFLVGSPGTNQTHIIFGQTSFPSATAGFSTSDLNGNNGFNIQGTGATGAAVNSVNQFKAGDINGDGLDDIIIGAPDANSSKCEVYVVFGHTGSNNSTFQLTDLNGTNGFKIAGLNTNDHLGVSISTGDVNGDGVSDLIMGASNKGADQITNSTNVHEEPGSVYVLFGHTNISTTNTELNNLSSANGFEITGNVFDIPLGSNGNQTINDRLGSAVTTIDINNDGIDDIVIGAPNHSIPSASSFFNGATYLILGNNNISSGGQFNVDSLNNSNGFVLEGLNPEDHFGTSLNNARDVNGDGIDDVIIGATGVDPDTNRTDAGSSYVIFGNNLNRESRIVGGTTNDTIDGSSGADNISGGAGDDVIRGGGGQDILSGGKGNDTIAINDNTFKEIKGGSGFDAIQFDGQGFTLDLTLKGDTVSGIEAINLGNTNNLLKLATDNVFSFTNSNNLLRVFGTSSDAVDIVDGLWLKASAIQSEDLSTLANNASIPSPFEYIEYTNSTATLRIDTRIGTLTIDDSTLSVQDSSAPESDGIIIFTLTQSGATTGTATVDYSTVIGSGDNASSADFTAQNGTITFTDESVKTITITINNDNSAENNETFTLSLSNAQGANLTDNSGTGTIFNSGGNNIELSNIEAGMGGFVINGVSSDDQSSVAISNAGDINGDGLDDLIIGARYGDPHGSDSGASFVVFGKTDSSAIELSSIEAGTGGFVINGASGADQSGFSVSNAGDVNGDGFDDLLVGAHFDDPNGSNSGASFVIFGGQNTSATVGTTSADTLTGTTAANQLIGGQGADLIGNGGADVLRGGSGNDILTISDNTFATIKGGTGKDTLRLDANFNLDLTNIPNTKLDSIEIIDLNSQGSTLTLGNDDIINMVGTEAHNELKIKGTSGDTVNISNTQFNKSIGSEITLDSITYDIFTNPNVDSSVQLLIQQGITVTQPTLAAIELSNIEAGQGGFVINGVSVGDQSGYSVSNAGDVNGDGLDDLIIGAYADDPHGSNSGASFVVFGKTDGNSVELSAIEAGTGGFVIHGVATEDRASSVGAAGDVNGDGLADLIVGANEDDPNGTSSGGSYVIFGGLNTSATVGTSGSDTLIGDSSANQLIGGRGADTLIGNGGADVLRGGEGNDVLAISDTSAFKLINGGTGSDTLRLDGSDKTLNLTSIADNKIQSIENIDLSQSGNHSVILKLSDVLNISDTSNTLKIFGSSTADSVTADSETWNKGTSTEGFTPYTLGLATLLVQDTIDTTSITT